MQKKLLIDNRFLEIARKKWGSEFKILPSYTLPHAASPVCCHPDMSILRVGDTWICEKSAFSYYQKLLPDTNLIQGETVVFSHYPKDIAYNVLISGKTAAANFLYTDSAVKETLEKQGYELLNVRQGYAKCASVVFKNAVITADTSIIKAISKKDIDVLFVSQGGVRLDGYEYGFLGGASGFAFGKLLFFGDITKHKDYEKIKAFTEKHEITIDYIENFPLTDVGTIIGIEEE